MAGKYLYGEKQMFIVLRNAIDLERYINVNKQELDNLRKELQIEDDELVIGNVGRFDRVKNQEFFIELAKEFIKENRKNFKIVLVGQGERFNYIEEKIKKEKLEKYFRMTGARNDVHIFMNMFDIFMMPSLYEGFPLVVVEALAGNAICYLSNNIPEETNIIESRVNFFDLNIEKKVLIENMYNEMQNKREINIKEKLVKQGFSIQNMVEQICSIYENRRKS